MAGDEGELGEGGEMVVSGVEAVEEVEGPSMQVVKGQGNDVVTKAEDSREAIEIFGEVLAFLLFSVVFSF